MSSAIGCPKCGSRSAPKPVSDHRSSVSPLSLLLGGIFLSRPRGQSKARLRDRAAYKRALHKCGADVAQVQTMRGCIVQKESFRALVKQIDRGDYDMFLSQYWPDQRR